MSQWDSSEHPEANCMSTCLAMVLTRLHPDHALRLAGAAEGSKLKVGRLIDQVVDALKQLQGRSKNGIERYPVVDRLVGSLGLSLQAQSGVDDAKLRKGLAQGKQAILVGDWLALPDSGKNELAPTQDAGHAIVVAGYDAGREMYAVNDPARADRKPTYLSFAELAAFVNQLNRDIDRTTVGQTLWISG
jgi:hypothetical protein